LNFGVILLIVGLLKNTQDILKSARLDRQLSFAHILKEFINPFTEEEKEAKLILGYVSLRSMCESAIKLFMTVHVSDYLKDELLITIKPKEGSLKKPKIILPPRIGFDDLIKIYTQRGDVQFEPFLKRVQLNGNTIHHFKDREITDQQQLSSDIENLKNLIIAVDQQLYYPDEFIPS
tara:strand:+ start:31209 stop:31739 length:531 start_codon:yes stop_codon:yes gene_type:complete